MLNPRFIEDSHAEDLYIEEKRKTALGSVLVLHFNGYKMTQKIVQHSLLQPLTCWVKREQQSQETLPPCDCSHRQ